MEPETAFGIVLRELRKRQGLSQEALAHDAELERNYVSLLELGRNSASVKMIFKLAPVLGITVADFMGRVEALQKDAMEGSKKAGRRVPIARPVKLRKG